MILDTRLLLQGTRLLSWDTRQLPSLLICNTRRFLGAELLVQNGEHLVQLASCHQCVAEEVEVSLQERREGRRWRGGERMEGRGEDGGERDDDRGEGVA